MGDYGRYEPSEKQLDAVTFLLAYGSVNKHIQLDYKLVAQNQVGFIGLMLFSVIILVILLD